MIAIIKDRGETYVSPVFVEKVAVVPGDAFGCAGKYHVRCSYATSMANLDKAASRIEKYIREYF